MLVRLIQIFEKLWPYFETVCLLRAVPELWGRVGRGRFRLLDYNTYNSLKYKRIFSILTESLLQATTVSNGNNGSQLGCAGGNHYHIG